jgi:hypothetical protein
VAGKEKRKIFEKYFILLAFECEVNAQCKNKKEKFQIRK